MVLRRIELAIARLEAAAQQPRRDPAASAEQAAASDARLREAVRSSLRRIDALVAQHGADQ